MKFSGHYGFYHQMLGCRVSLSVCLFVCLSVRTVKISEFEICCRAENSRTLWVQNAFKTLASCAQFGTNQNLAFQVM